MFKTSFIAVVFLINTEGECFKTAVVFLINTEGECLRHPSQDILLIAVVFLINTEGECFWKPHPPRGKLCSVFPP